MKIFSFRAVLFACAVSIDTLFALVDYSPRSLGNTPQSDNGSAARSTLLGGMSEASAPSAAPNVSGSGGIGFSLSTEYGQLLLDENRSTQVMTYHARYFSPYSVYVDFSYFNTKLQNRDGIMPGNLTMLLGLNWFQLTPGGGRDATQFNLLAGGSLGQKGSIAASSSNAAIMGLETSKEFRSLILGLQFKIWLPESPVGNYQLPIKRINQGSVAVGLSMTRDIRLSVEGAMTTITGLPGKDLKFGRITPRLSLGPIASLFTLDFGGHFVTRRDTYDQLERAKLWNFPGVYGNAYFVGLSISV